MAAMLGDSTVVVRTGPRAIPLPMITMRKSVHGFLLPYMVMGLRLAFGPPEPRYKDPLCDLEKININELFIGSKYGSYRLLVDNSSH